MSDPDLVNYYVACPPGLEPILAAEYHQLGLVRVKNKKEEHPKGNQPPGEETGGMDFEGPLEHVYLANLHLRSASRVVVRLGDFYAAAFSELRKKASRLDWERYIRPGQKVSIRVVCHKSKLYHSDAVAERVLGSINDHFSVSAKPQKETTLSDDGQLILVRIVNDHCTISIDSSGDLLHKRGYRLATAKAPLRENLAAAMVLASGWDKVSPLIDPFCGSGTILIEAAMIARNIAPGIARSFRFADWPGMNQDVWQKIINTARNTMNQSNPPLFGYDRDTGAVDMANANAARAGQKGLIHFKSQAVSFLEPTSEPGWIITNPPYGVRVSENKDLRDLYARFGTILKEHFPNWKVNVLSSEDRLLANLNLEATGKTIHFSNGGIPVKYVSFVIPDGSN